MSDKVICPACAHEFGAVPVSVQERLAQGEPVGINGLTEAETAATASVMGFPAPEAKQELVAGSGEPQIIGVAGFCDDGVGYTAEQLAGAVAREMERCARECDSMLIMSCTNEAERGFNEGLRRAAAAIRS